MKIAALADLHLGFTQFLKVNADGLNQREVDVSETFTRVVDMVIAESPDLVTVAGDVFHKVSPGNPAIVHAFNQFARLRRALPLTEVILVAGNHDSPATADAGCILQLFRGLRFHVVEREAQVIELPALECEVLAVPDVLGMARPLLRPTTALRHRVLLMHGEIAGMLPKRGHNDIDVGDMHADDWSVICLGHWHVYREVAPRAFYSGSIDYTSTNPWGELDEERERGVPGKGFVVHDLTARAHRFVPVVPSRRFINLGTIDTRDLTAPEIDAAIARAIDGHMFEIDDAVVRVVLKNLRRHRLHDLDKAAIAGYRARAFQLQIDVRAPDEVDVLHVDPAAPRRSLEQMLTAALRERQLPAEIAREPFVASGLTYLRTATDRMTTPVALENAA
jgi:hypothetical protein